MAVYNAEVYLSEAIDSVLNQEYKNWELICVNDGSVDSSWDILSKYSNIDERIKIISSIHSGNASSARNKALPSVTGEYVCILDSDDKFEPDSLYELVSVIYASNASFVVFSTKFCDSQCNVVIKELSGFYGKFDIILSGEKAFIESLQWKISGFGAIKSELVQRLKWNEIGMNGDELSTRLFFLESGSVAFTKGSYLYRKHPESTTSKMSKHKFLTLDTSRSLISLIERYNLGEKIKLVQINRYENEVRGKYRALVNNKNAFELSVYNDLMEYIKGHFFELYTLEYPTHTQAYIIKQVRWVLFKCNFQLKYIKKILKTKIDSIIRTKAT